MPKAVLAGLKDAEVRLSAICAMLDTGGSTGRLRKDYKILAPGDIRRAFLALANTSPIIENLFNYRFEVGELKGHNIANLLIAALELSTKNYEETIEALNKILNLKHQVLPITLEKSEVCAVLENGEIMRGETGIDKTVGQRNLKVKKVFLDPEVLAYPKALETIKEADMVIIGPGDLYSTLAQLLLCRGTQQAIKESKGKIVYISNLMTKRGETDDFSVLDFTQEIEGLLGGELDYVVYNMKQPSSQGVEDYRRLHPELIELTKINDNLPKDKFIGADLLRREDRISHDPKKLSKLLLSLI